MFCVPFITILTQALTFRNKGIYINAICIIGNQGSRDEDGRLEGSVSRAIPETLNQSFNCETTGKAPFLGDEINIFCHITTFVFNISPPKGKYNITFCQLAISN